MLSIAEILSQELGQKLQYVQNVIDLMDEGNTIPFIARYRKEMHGTMDDTTLRNLETRLTYLRNLQERRDEVKKSIENQGKLTEELSAAIDNAATLAEVEDLYRPYKQKRRTRASIAREKGLEPLAEAIFAQDAAGESNSLSARLIDLIAPIGTPIGAVIEFVGGTSDEVGKVLYGGPMMGVPVQSVAEPIIKTTNAITVMSRKDSIKADSIACVHCGRCVAACPMGLNPTSFSKALEIESKEEKVGRLEENKINLCMECGCCSFVCPSLRPLVQNNRLAKTVVRTYRDHMKDKK